MNDYGYTLWMMKALEGLEEEVVSCSAALIDTVENYTSQ